MSEMINLDAVTEGLRTIASLRNGVSDLFKCLTEGVGGPLIDPYSGLPKVSDTDPYSGQYRSGEIDRNDGSDPTEEAEKQFLTDVQGIVDGITKQIHGLERSCELLSHPSAQVNAHLTLLGQDPALDRNGVYKSVVSCYRWCDRMHDYATQTTLVLNQNIARRNTIAIDPLQRVLVPGGIGRRTSFATINTPPSQIDGFFNNLARLHPNVTLEISRPFGAPTVIFITLDKTLKGCLLLHGLLIEWIVVKGINEDFKTADGSVDIWSDSRYEVFKKISDHCNSATLNFSTPIHVDLAVRSWLNWFVSYSTLFTKPCRKCNNRLLDGSPPTWRDFRNADSYHEKCRP